MTSWKKGKHNSTVGTWSTIAKLRRLVDSPLLMALSGSSYGSITPGSIREDAGVADIYILRMRPFVVSNHSVSIRAIEL